MREALGQSDAFLSFVEQLSRVAGVDRPVLVVGERGTGKELAAAKIHYLSRRWESPLVALNCAALAPALMEAELFGHERGAFTGAATSRAGRFEAADGGTLLLDEIGLIPIEVQEKILRTVEYGSFERVGSSKPQQVDVRIVGATNADLPALVQEGRFKADLLDRLAFEVIRVPPLRERGDDILLLAHHFAGRMALELGREQTPTFSAKAKQALHAHDWPGNVRELKNVIERAVYRSDTTTISELIFDPFAAEPSRSQHTLANPSTKDADAPSIGILGGTAASSTEPLPHSTAANQTPLLDAIASLEVTMLKQALAETRYHQRKAAEQLGITYHQFRGLYRKHVGALKPPPA
ncbi:MAG: phage shock protein operon transcriptional activator [Planctomycetota bacterium]|nr:phage shock protein operon transcriptional activator [Planctomycetota bacterium]